MSAGQERKERPDAAHTGGLLEESARDTTARMAAEAARTATGSHDDWQVDLEGQSEQIVAAVQLLERLDAPQSSPEDAPGDRSEDSDESPEEQRPQRDEP
jgi:hypothetical protein